MTCQNVKINESHEASLQNWCSDDPKSIGIGYFGRLTDPNLLESIILAVWRYTCLPNTCLPYTVYLPTVYLPTVYRMSVFMECFCLVLAVYIVVIIVVQAVDFYAFSDVCVQDNLVRVSCKESSCLPSRSHSVSPLSTVVTHHIDAAKLGSTNVWGVCC